MHTGSDDSELDQFSEFADEALWLGVVRVAKDEETPPVYEIYLARVGSPEKREDLLIAGLDEHQVRVCRQQLGAGAVVSVISQRRSMRAMLRPCAVRAWRVR
jgi:hypothetical protein